jgi:hypothetical protein
VIINITASNMKNRRLLLFWRRREAPVTSAESSDEYIKCDHLNGHFLSGAYSESVGNFAWNFRFLIIGVWAAKISAMSLTFGGSA